MAIWEFDDESLESVLSIEAPAMCPLMALNQAGEVKRWTMVALQRSRRDGETVGSCVAITTRAPRWRCWRMIDRSVSVNSPASEDSAVRNYIC